MENLTHFKKSKSATESNFNGKYKYPIPHRYGKETLNRLTDCSIYAHVYGMLCKESYLKIQDNDF